jgi:hypothetical protein
MIYENARKRAMRVEFSSEVFTRVPTLLFVEHRDDEERGFYEL